MQSKCIRREANRGAIANVSSLKNQHSDSTSESENQDGFIIVKKGEGVFYVRYDIIFAKAGDVFYMPRKVPKDFNLDSDQVIPFQGTAGEFEKFYNDNFVPVRMNRIKQLTNLSGSLQ